MHNKNRNSHLDEFDDSAFPKYQFKQADIRCPKAKQNKLKPAVPFKAKEVLKIMRDSSNDSERVRRNGENELTPVREMKRPASNQLDRYGRVAFNKNHELSQASLEVDLRNSENNFPLANMKKELEIVEIKDNKSLNFQPKKRKPKSEGQLL